MTTVVLVEGESDRLALETLAARLGVRGFEVVAIGGAQAVRRVVAARRAERAVERPGESIDGRIVGLVDAGERREFERVLDPADVHVCHRDLEDELIRALGVERVLAILDEHGELESFGRLRQQPALRTASTTDQLRRFLGGRSGNKLRYASILVDALDLDRVPAPLRALLADR